MGTHKMPPDCEVVPPSNGLLSTSITVNPCACPAMAAAQPPAPDPMQIQSTVEDHGLACIRLPSQRNRAVDRRPTAWPCQRFDAHLSPGTRVTSLRPTLP